MLASINTDTRPGENKGWDDEWLGSGGGRSEVHPRGMSPRRDWQGVERRDECTGEGRGGGHVHPSAHAYLDRRNGCERFHMRDASPRDVRDPRERDGRDAWAASEGREGKDGPPREGGRWDDVRDVSRDVRASREPMREVWEGSRGRDSRDGRETREREREGR